MLTKGVSNSTPGEHDLRNLLNRPRTRAATARSKEPVCTTQSGNPSKASVTDFTTDLKNTESRSTLPDLRHRITERQKSRITCTDSSAERIKSDDNDNHKYNLDISEDMRLKPLDAESSGTEMISECLQNTTEKDDTRIVSSVNSRTSVERDVSANTNTWDRGYDDQRSRAAANERKIITYDDLF